MKVIYRNSDSIICYFLEDDVEVIQDDECTTLAGADYDTIVSDLHEDNSTVVENIVYDFENNPPYGKYVYDGGVEISDEWIEP